MTKAFISQLRHWELTQAWLSIFLLSSRRFLVVETNSILPNNVTDRKNSLLKITVTISKNKEICLIYLFESHCFRLLDLGHQDSPHDFSSKVAVRFSGKIFVRMNFKNVIFRQEWYLLGVFSWCQQLSDAKWRCLTLIDAIPSHKKPKRPSRMKNTTTKVRHNKLSLSTGCPSGRGSEERLLRSYLSLLFPRNCSTQRFLRR